MTHASVQGISYLIPLPIAQRNPNIDNPITINGRLMLPDWTPQRAIVSEFIYRVCDLTFLNFTHAVYFIISVIFVYENICTRFGQRFLKSKCPCLFLCSNTASAHDGQMFIASFTDKVYKKITKS